MKYFLTTILLFFLAISNAQTQTAEIEYPLKEDVSTISGIIRAAYEVISGEAGTPRQWKRDSSLHDPNAIVSYYTEVDGKPSRVVMTEEEYQNMFDDNIKSSFYENEIHREVRVFGSVAHVWSTYVIRNEKDGPVLAKGINSIQLYYKNDRWWILSWNWDYERENVKIPRSFDPSE